MEHFYALYDYYKGLGHSATISNSMALSSIQAKDSFYDSAQIGEITPID